jgi:Protein NO VEIN, C-terminal
VVFAYKKENTVGLVGEVVGGYRYERSNSTGSEDGLDYANQRRVRWWGPPFVDFDRGHLDELSIGGWMSLRGTIHVIDGGRLLMSMPKKRLRDALAERLRRKLLGRMRDDAKLHRRGPRWNHDEVVLALDTYMDGRKVPNKSDSRVRKLASMLDRPVGAVVYKIGNLQYLDTGGKKGWSNLSETDRKVWKEFKGKGRLLRIEAEKALKRFSMSPDDEIQEDERLSKGQGFGLSAEGRKQIEEIAMKRAMKHFVSKGYDTEDMHIGHPYDLKCNNGKNEVFVEVKGTTGGGRKVLLTRGEVDFARRHNQSMALYLVHSISMRKSMNPNNGTSVVVMPWKIKERNLTPSRYEYEI